MPADRVEYCPVKVKAGGVISKIAGAIAYCVREGCRSDVIAIGEPAIATAIRSVAVARYFLIRSNQIETVCVPFFRTVEGSRGERRALVIAVICTEKINQFEVELGEMYAQSENGEDSERSR